MFSSADEHRAGSGSGEYVTNWRVVYTFLGLALLPVCGSISWLFVMGSVEPVEVSVATSRGFAGRPSHRIESTRSTMTVEAAAIDVNLSDQLPWRELPANERSPAQAELPLPQPDQALAEQSSSVSVADAGRPAASGGESQVVDPRDESKADAIPYEWQLLDELDKQAVELDFEAVKGSSKRVLDAGSDRGQDVRLALLQERDDVRDLPFRDLAKCEKSAGEAVRMAELSVLLGRAVTNVGRARDAEFQSGYVEFMAEERLVKMLETPDRWNRAEYISTLVQVLQVQSVHVRIRLIRLLADISDRRASVALAQRAIFDVSPEVREAAIEALKDRPRSHVRNQLLQGLRYPWPTASRHAAQTLIGLDDQSAVESLIALLDEPDPTAPLVNENGQWSKRELVRVNHLRNCVLCHAPSASRDDRVRGMVPVPGKAIPVQYYQRASGSFVRADITYLQQDFSTMHEVQNAAPWPLRQRFDYFIRTRELSADERAEEERRINSAPHGDQETPRSYPQREAVLLALRELTGQDHGPSSESWRAFQQGRDN